MIIYKCDRCAETINRPEDMTPIALPLTGEDVHSGDMFYGTWAFSKKDLCPTCYNEFKTWWEERVNK